ncbi:hypothetical protein GGF31_003173 [Allomyces arbusculus]|nr:hypothetical protein GGF31_003173 [Allomyces arbusculus]
METASKVPPAPSRRQVGTDAALVADSKDANEAARFAPSSGHGRRRWYNGTTELAPIDKRRAALVLARRTGTWVLNRLASGWLFIILLAYPSHVTNEEELTPPQYKESLYDDAKQDICRVADWIMGRKQESGGDNDKDNAAHLE